jgi:CHAT domain-containing protein
VGATTRSEGPLGLARAFLVAGAAMVVASQEPVSDRAALALAVAFHREFRRTGDAPAALQSAQLALLNSTDREFSAPTSWAPFVVVGSETPRVH